MAEWHVVYVDGVRKRVAIARAGATTWVFVDGNTFTLTDGQGGAARAKSGGTGSVMSPMPATVVSINTSAGAQVKDGDVLIVLEAMKMELPIKAPRAGVVKAVHCSKGELVQPGTDLVELE